MKGKVATGGWKMDKLDMEYRRDDRAPAFAAKQEVGNLYRYLSSRGYDESTPGAEAIR
jgi:hypothetical protein